MDSISHKFEYGFNWITIPNDIARLTKICPCLYSRGQICHMIVTKRAHMPSMYNTSNKFEMIHNSVNVTDVLTYLTTKQVVFDLSDCKTKLTPFFEDASKILLEKLVSDMLWTSSIKRFSFTSPPTPAFHFLSYP